jgi:hypothetical protein
VIDTRLGRLAHDQHLLPATSHLALDGSGAGTRVLLAQPAGGLHARILLDRGLDIGAAWYAGQPVSWTSPSGDRRSGYADGTENWHRGWTGGLVTTCGLMHIGPPSGRHGRHGRYSDCPPEEVRVERENRILRVTGTIRDTDGLDRGLVLKRTIELAAGSGTLRLHDLVVNETMHAVAAPILYHLNFGYPFLVDASVTRLVGLAAGHGFTATMGAPADVPDEVAMHRVDPGTGAGAQITLSAPEIGLEVAVGWDGRELDRAHTWRRRTPGCYVHAIEPGNAALIDDGSDPWPVLEPGDQRSTGFDLTVGHMTSGSITEDDDAQR